LKKVLVLAYDFPPLISIGAQRPYSWYKYFGQNGYQVTVVTRQWSGSYNAPEDFIQPLGAKVEVESDANRKVIRVPYAPNLRDKLLLKYGYHKFSLLRKLLSFFYTFAEHLLLSFDAKANIYYEAEKQIQAERPDVIIATGEPFILFKYASLLAAKHNIPWVADYRDGWTTNQGNYVQGFLQRLQMSFFRKREQQYIAHTVMITTPAPEYAAALKQLHTTKQVEVVYNGYDEDAFVGLGSIQPPNDRFVISYAGIIYPHQKLEMFLEGLDKFLDKEGVNESDVQVNFYGLNSQPDSVQRVLQQCKHKAALNFTNRMPYTEIVKKLKASHIQLLLSAKGANWLNAKVFDYLGTGQSILLVENDGGVLEQMLQLGNGAAMNSVDEVAAYLQRQYDLYKYDRVEVKPVSEAAKQYTRANQAKNFCALLDLKLKAEK
jgi:glycosyltransferase involved in cell wall biosynthesis